MEGGIRVELDEIHANEGFKRKSLSFIEAEIEDLSVTSSNPLEEADISVKLSASLCKLVSSNNLLAPPLWASPMWS
jgi:hypothetical protein